MASAERETMSKSEPSRGLAAVPLFDGSRPPLQSLSRLVRVFVRPVHLSNLGLPFPPRPVFLVKFHELDR